jgi:MFS family permease
MGDDKTREGAGRVPLEIWILGVVSFFTDVSSELFFSILPYFLTTVLGASERTLGLMEGLADFTASSLDLVSGYFSDRAGRRKGFAALGYAFSTGAKGLLLLATTVPSVVGVRILERFGKSVRGAPRDALLAAIASESKRGFSFGVHKAMDRAGAVIGPLVAWIVLERLGKTLEVFRQLFAVAFVPAVVAVLVFVLFVKERPIDRPPRASLRSMLDALGRPYKLYLVAATIFSFGYFSYAFLLEDAKREGFEPSEIALLYALLNLAFSLVSIPLGVLGDRIGRRAIIGLGYVLYGSMLATLGFVPGKAGVIAGLVLFGLFSAIDDGQTKAYLADLSDKEHRATAIGTYNFVTGLAYVPASLIAGALWERESPEIAFAFAGATTAVAAVVFALVPGPRASATR